MRFLFLVSLVFLGFCSVVVKCETRKQLLQKFSRVNFDDVPGLKNSKWRPQEGDRRPPLSTKNAKKNEILDDFISGLVECYNVLGLTVSVVHQDEVVFSKGYGLRSIDPPLPVDENTLFGIGSTTKAFTSTLLAMYEDNGLLDWDAPIGDILPQVVLEDEYATEMLSLRDMVAHKSGLSRNDYWWISDPQISREDFLERIKFFGMNLQFRRQWQYNNLMWAAAGFAGAEVVDSTWEDEIQNRIFGPLGMNTATPFVEEAVASGNYALPYGLMGYDDNGEPIYLAMPEDINTVIELLNPAGGISASARDMAEWIRFQLNFGAVNTSQLLSREALEKTLLPEMSILPALPGIVRPAFPVDATTLDYGLGWDVGTYRGHISHAHGGGTLGHSTWLWMLRDAEFGIYFSAIGDALAAITTEQLSAMFAADLYLGFEPWLDVPSACNFPCDFVPCDVEGNSTKTVSQDAKKIKKVSKPVATEYVGIYHDDGWGNLIIEYDEVEEMLLWKFNRVTGTLSPSVNPDLVFASISGEYVSILGPALLNPFQFSRGDPSIPYEAITTFDFEPTMPPTFVRM